jgi:ankyrin repeat protein
LRLYAAGLRAIGNITHGGNMKQLPKSPNLSHLKKQAKDLLRAFEQNNPSAQQRFLASLPSLRGMDAKTFATQELRLHDAQSCIAREYGFASWTELKDYVGWKAVEQQDRESIVKRWLALVYGHGFMDPQPKLAVRLLRERPDLVAGDSWLACAVGDQAQLRSALDADSEWVNRAGGPLRMPPLVAVTHSGLVRDLEFTQPLEHCAKLLLDHGADPDQSWISPEFPDFPLSALYGAAGKNHDAGMTRILLEAGASPNDNESLYHSVESSDLTCTRMLLDAGAVVDGTNAIGRALDYDRIEGLRLLLKHGGDPGKRSTSIAPTGALSFPLFHAIKRGRSLAHIQLLLDFGADVDVANDEGMTPYRYALFQGHPEIAALVRSGNEMEAFSREELFVAACARADRAAVRMCLSADPEIVHRLSEGQLRQLSAVKVMVEAGWPIHVTGGDWEASALNLAVYRGQAEMAEFLLAHGASWEEKHGFGDNVVGTLSFASRADNVETDSGDWLACAKSLIAHGMPVPPERYEFSEEVTDYFESLRDVAVTS